MPLQEDRIRALEGRTPLPEGSPTELGTVATYAGVDEDGNEFYELTRPSSGDVLQGAIDPNDAIVGYSGQLYTQRGTTPRLWQNSDGYAAWQTVSGFGATQHDYFLDPTGTSLSSSGLLTWVTAATVYPASDGLLDISTPTQPEVVTPGIYTVEVTVATPADDLADHRIVGSMIRGGDALVVMPQAAPISSTNTIANVVSLTMRHECQAGDLFLVVTQFSGGGSHSPYKLSATVEAEI